MKNTLELRMYGLVPYQLTGIQKGIQYGHAKDEYSIHHNTEEYQDWLNNHKTYIILNGGTTNTNPLRLGTMNKHLATLEDLGVKCSGFYEPGLGDQLTGIAFILDERIFNKEKYPDYTEWIARELVFNDHYSYKEWVDFIGGVENISIREFIKQFKLA